MVKVTRLSVRRIPPRADDGDARVPAPTKQTNPPGQGGLTKVETTPEKEALMPQDKFHYLADYYGTS